jgi:hypothetical protein
MSTLSRMIGFARTALESRDSSQSPGPGRPSRTPGGGDARGGPAQRTAEPDLADEDRRAIARYDYLLRTAEPDQLERVHREAFERLTPAQREEVLGGLRYGLPTADAPRSHAPEDLARAATRAEVSRPGTLETLLARGDGGGRSRGARGIVGTAGIGAAGGLLGLGENLSGWGERLGRGDDPGDGGDGFGLDDLLGR